MKAVGEPDAGKPPARFDEGLLGNARSLLYHINFIALMMHYRIYAMLKSKGMQRKYSPGDVLVHLERVNRLKIGDE
ncbi:MAG: hypothetical protein RE469_09505 [Cuniculiplasma divulgatum]|nr:MAG: hypothetical protein RE469_09505 [Cuniculiplasma divulgatum]